MNDDHALEDGARVALLQTALQALLKYRDDADYGELCARYATDVLGKMRPLCYQQLDPFVNALTDFELDQLIGMILCHRRPSEILFASLVESLDQRTRARTLTDVQREAFINALEYVLGPEETTERVEPIPPPTQYPFPIEGRKPKRKG